MLTEQTLLYLQRQLQEAFATSIKLGYPQKLVTIFKNPTTAELAEFVVHPNIGIVVRYFLTDNDLFVWDALQATHAQVRSSLPLSYESESGYLIFPDARSKRVQFYPLIYPSLAKPEQLRRDAQQNFQSHPYIKQRALDSTMISFLPSITGMFRSPNDEY